MTSISRSRSARSFFSRAFSCWRLRSALTSAASSWPYRLRHRYSVCSLMPCFFATSATGALSASRRILTIWSSVNRDLRMGSSLCREPSSQDSAGPKIARQVTHPVAMLWPEARRSARLSRSLQRRRGAQCTAGERQICSTPGTAELFAGPMGASTAGDVAHTQVRNAPLQGGLSLGCFSLATKREVTRSPPASGGFCSERRTSRHRHVLAFADERPAPRRKRTPST